MHKYGTYFRIENSQGNSSLLSDSASEFALFHIVLLNELLYLQ
jgi:hypothetical protein